MEQQSSTVKKQSLVKYAVIGLLAVLPILGFIAGRFSNMQSIKTKESSGAAPSSQPSYSNSITVSPTPSDQIEIAYNSDGYANNLTLNQVTDIISQNDYPKELLTGDGSGYIGMQCSHANLNGEGLLPDHMFYTKTDGSKGNLITNPLFINFTKQAIAQKKEPSVTGVFVCKTYLGNNQNGYIVQLEATYGGGGGGDNTYIFQADASNKLIRKGYLLQGPAPYFSCDQPYMLTKSGLLYNVCAGGDEGGYVGIYKTDLNKGEGNLLYGCASGFTPPGATTPATPTCATTYPKQ